MSDGGTTGGGTTGGDTASSATTGSGGAAGPDDPVMAEIDAAARAGHAGDRAEARTRFSALWDRIGPGGDPLHRCTLAHLAADVEDDPRDELEWDVRALAAADELTDERARRFHPSLSAAGFYPSLHLNLADVHRRLGSPADARRHLDLARDRVGTLNDDGYGRMIRNGIERCGERLDLGDRSALS